MFHWGFIDDSLMILWWTIEVTPKISFEALLTFKGFFDFFSETLMFHCSFVDDSLLTLWRVIFETLIISMETFLIFIVFVVLTSESLLFPCFFIDDWLMTLWRNVDGTTKIWMRTLKIIEVSNVIIIRTLMFLCCLVAYPLMILWRIFVKILMISKQTLVIINFCCCQKHWRFIAPSSMIVDDSLERHIWNIDNFDANFFDLYCFCCVNLWITDISLLLHRCFVDDFLKNHWSYSENLVWSIIDL